MRKTRVFIAALITVLLFCTDVYAKPFWRSRTNTDDEFDVIGQVTIKNVDSADKNIRLNGAHIKIVNKETGEEYTDIIRDNGTLVYQLPLGSYSLTQVLAPNEYQLNSKIYEFTLKIPENEDMSNVRVVNASIEMTNELIAEEVEQVNEPEDEPADTADMEAEPPSLIQDDAFENIYGEEYTDDWNDPATGFMAADRNPATADNSNIILAALLLSFIILAGGLLFKKYRF